MDSHLHGLISRLVHHDKTHGLLAAEAAAMAHELDTRRHRGEAALIRATARNHRIRQLEASANVAALQSLLRTYQPSRT